MARSNGAWDEAHWNGQMLTALDQLRREVYIMVKELPNQPERIGQASLVQRVWPWSTATKGGGGVWHDAFVDCCLQLAAPIARSPLTLALPFTSLPPLVAVPIGLSSPCPPSPCLAYPYFPASPSFPLGGCANLPLEPLDCP